MTLFSDKPGDEGLPGKARCLAMIAVMITTTMNVFDASMINIALPTISQTLRVPASAAIWVMNAYLLSVAMTLAIFAALATRIGYRVQFVAGLGLFTLASLGCAGSSSLPLLIVMRFVQGIGGAATLSIAPALLKSVFPRRLLGRILGLNALLIALCTALAPILGGTILAFFRWQWLFAMNLPLGIAAITLVLRTIDNQPNCVTERFDTLGAVMSAIALGSLIMCANSFSQIASDSAQWRHPIEVATSYAGAALISTWVFIRRQRRAERPLIPLAMFSSARFSLAAFTSLISFVSQNMTFIVLPFLFENVYGYSALQSALLFTPWPIGIALAAPRAGRLADQYKPAYISTIGLTIFAAGLLSLALLPTSPAIWDLCWRNLLCGIGFGLFQSPNNREMLANVAMANSSYASGVLAIMRTFGQCLGAACVGIILSILAHIDIGRVGAGSSIVRSIHLCFYLALGGSILAILLSLSRIRKPDFNCVESASEVR
ncbi:MFS transporter [Celerinatantimonas yamalensis]|uniref:MFS transporter n=1 Tax=Celerinatantimonas yamalensis TaxID=559956 RepID=A0ABW9G413_9GAMM